MPRAALLAALPVGVFLIAAGISLGTGGGGNERLPDLGVAVLPAQAEPTPTATPAPAANRTDCAAISGSDYRSSEEREWFLKNCVSAVSSGAAASTQPISSGAPRTTTSSAPAATGGSQTPMGDTLVIPAAGVNASVYRVYVEPSAPALPNPFGYFYALWYDLSAFPGYGGYVDGNMVLAGHVDCAACRNGGPGAAVFYNMRYVKAGDTIDYSTADGKVYRYAVTSVVSYPNDVNILPLVGSEQADMTIITCIGTWNAAAHQYSDRLFVFANLI